MRKIKFRAWDTRTRCWADYGIDLINPNYPKKDEQRTLEIDTNISNIEIMQYAGLKDKLGVEIYEGDIVKAQIDENNYKIFEVRFYNQSFALHNKKGHYSYFCNIANKLGKVFEVIGNIYEDKELLK